MFHLFQFPILPVWLHKHAMRAFFVVEKPTRGYFSFHSSRLATQARHACLFCCRETYAWVLQFPLFPFGYTSTPCVPFLLSRNTRVGTSVSIVPVWLHKHAMRAFFVVEKHTRGYLPFTWENRKFRFEN